jgi:endonuclease YncB( thermonuclease family)
MTTVRLIGQGKRQMSQRNRTRTYPAAFIRAVDGDTADFLLDKGFGDRSKKRLRLKDIDTCELNSKDAEKRGRAVAAKEFVQKMLGPYDYLTGRFDLLVRTYLTRSGKEKATFGRYVAEIELPNGETLGSELIKAGLAEPWTK